MPAAVAATTPEVLSMLFPICPLIIFSYALIEYPAAFKLYLAVPTPVTSAATTPELDTKLVIPVALPVVPNPNIPFSFGGGDGTSATSSSSKGIQPFVASA